MIGHRLSIKGQGVGGHNYKVEIDGHPLQVMGLVLEMDAESFNKVTLKLVVSAIDSDVEVEPGLTPSDEVARYSDGGHFPNAVRQWNEVRQ